MKISRRVKLPKPPPAVRRHGTEAKPIQLANRAELLKQLASAAQVAPATGSAVDAFARPDDAKLAEHTRLNSVLTSAGLDVLKQFIDARAPAPAPEASKPPEATQPTEATAPPPVRGLVDILGNDQVRTIDGTTDVTATGNRARITITGHCPELRLTGNDNEVVVEGSVGKIISAGNGNRVTWRSDQEPQPEVISSGFGNSIGPRG